LITFFSFITREKEMFDRFNANYKSLVPLFIILYSFAIQYLLSRHIKNLVESNPEIIKRYIGYRWIAWLTIPLLVVIFFIMVKLAYSR
jgi:Na+/H+ antiporter NhaC